MAKKKLVFKKIAKAHKLERQANRKAKYNLVWKNLMTPEKKEV
jgi:hypothetical protein